MVTADPMTAIPDAAGTIPAAAAVAAFARFCRAGAPRLRPTDAASAAPDRASSPAAATAE